MRFLSWLLALALACLPPWATGGAGGLADMMGPRLGQRVIVDNRPGAGGTIGALHVAQQPPDGCTLMLSNTAPMPPPIVSRLHAAVAWALQQPQVLERLAQNGITPMSLTQEQFIAFLQQQVTAIGSAVRAMNITVD